MVVFETEPPNGGNVQRKVYIMAINNCIFSGNLAADAEKRGTDEHPVLSFTLCTNVPFKDANGWHDEPLYTRCVIFGNRAKALAPIMRKGLAVTVSGYMEPNNYEKNGNKVYAQQLRVAEVQLPPKPKDAGAW